MFGLLFRHNFMQKPHPGKEFKLDYQLEGGTYEKATPAERRGDSLAFRRTVALRKVSRGVCDVTDYTP